MTNPHAPMINFTHLLSGDDDLFPHCCGNGYFLLWGSHLESPTDFDELDDAEHLLREEISKNRHFVNS